ncbi:ATP synthase delta chain [hydrothermal vent metagenome]|uniref:ATP synthase delta chain n=1 Tax=hydrothermal vent metagenome TaxID=652676 RepID=A0A3B1C9U1_9ZZZZ
MKETAIASRYAKAFAESLGEGPLLDNIRKELDGVAEIFEENKQLRTIMLNPAIPLSVKKNVLEDIGAKIGVTQGTLKALLLVLTNGRINILKQIAEEFEKLVFETLGRVRVEVTSAMELSEDEMAALGEKLTALTGKKAVVDMKVDRSLIGGIVTKIGSSVSDGSVKNQLKTLQVGIN